MKAKRASRVRQNNKRKIYEKLINDGIIKLKKAYDVISQWEKII
jgi:predicted transcriptional regulator YheO